LALKKNQKYCFGELGNTTGQHSTAQHCSPGFAKLQAQAQAQNQASIVRQGSPRFAKVRQGSPRFAKLYLALALKKNKKYCFGELGNTTGQHSTAQNCTPSFRLRLKLRLRIRLPSFAKLRQGSPRFAKVCQGSPRFAKVRQGSPRFAKVRQGSPRFAKVRQGSPRFAKFRQGSPSYILHWR
jgi:hypothetical protein